LFEYLAKRFAEMLTKGDVMELFKMLEQRYGTISRVCGRIGIERRTFYHWRYAKQINSETKAKVLRVALEEHPIDTLEFLARKSRGRTKEVLELLIEFLRRGIIEEEDPKRAEELAKRAENIINEFSIPITEYLHHEIAELIEAAYSRGFEIRIKPYAGIQLPTTPLRTFAREHERMTLAVYTMAFGTAYSTPPITTEKAIFEYEGPQILPEVRISETLER